MEIRLLGPVELVGTPRRVALGTPRQRCVLAVLAMTPGQVVPIEAIVGRVWGQEPPMHVRNVVYTHVSRLRGALKGVSAHIVREAGGYVLALPPHRVDVYRARNLAARARVENDRTRAATLLASACAQWTATPLAGIDGDWAAATRQALRREHATLLLRRFSAELKLGRTGSLIGPLSEAMIQHPFDEPLAGLLMVVLYRTGRRADALALHDEVRRRLRDCLGVEPGHALERLHVQVLHRAPHLEDQDAPLLTGG
ncbi:AfsR/SARP family transcriptional regulator [Nonomuraea sp. B10E15]|uniref:AfsR/SARP family transcriptional regulator n=1 Tax=Nonomuraea sp. B10E15 TaxID=3153560 RepID=UPI00325F8798